VRAFRTSKEKNHSESSLYIQHSQSNIKTYPFFDNVHLWKNIHNTLLDNKKFVFPSFHFAVIELLSFGSQFDYIARTDLEHVHEHDSKLSTNSRKAHKLTFKALNSFNSKVFLLLLL